MYFTTIITASLALLGSTVMALPKPDVVDEPALGLAIPTNDGPACEGNSGINVFNSTKGIGDCQDYSIDNNKACLWIDPYYNVRSVHLRDGVGCALYSSKTCEINSKDDHAASLLQSVDDLYSDQSGFTALTFQPLGWQCSYWPPAEAPVPKARSVDTTDSAQIGTGDIQLCDKPRGQGNCGHWLFKNNVCVSIGDDFTIASIYINDHTTCWIYNNRVCNTDLSLNDKWAPLLTNSNDVIADGLGYYPHSWKCTDTFQ